MRDRILPLLVIALLSPAASATARTWHVPHDVATIAAAVDSSAAGDTVLVACGGYREHDIEVKSGIVLRSESGQPDCVVIDAEAAGRNLICDDAAATTVILGIRLLGGVGDGGGCLLIRGGSPRLENCDFEAGTSFSAGGGVECSAGAAPTFVGCGFLGNFATAGSGGGLFAGNAAPILIDCLFRGNRCTGGDGGGMAIDQGVLDLTGCTFADNRAEHYGGGLGANGCAGSVTGCEFVANLVFGGGGGGAHIGWGPVVIDTSTFTFNEALGRNGGGLETQGYNVVTATACTFTDNSAGTGGAIHGGSDLDLVECLVTDNAASGGGGGIALFGGLHLAAENTTILGNSGQRPADGFIPANSTAYLRCCEVDPANWVFSSTITRDDEGCDVPAEKTSWGAVKSQYR